MFQFLFMLPVAIIIATIAMLLGVGGALLFSPIFVIIFPLMGITDLSPADAFGAALITEVFGFMSGLIGYQKQRLIDFKTASVFIIVGVPLAVIGTIIKRQVSGQAIILVFAVGLWILAGYTLLNLLSEKHDHSDWVGEPRRLVSAEGEEFEYIFCNEKPGSILTGIGAFITGLISVGIGETTTTTLRLRCNLPMKVATGTSVLVVTAVVLSSAITDTLIIGVENVPWELVLFTIPGVLIGGQIGPRISNKISSETSEKLLIILFFFIGSVMAYNALWM